MQPLVCPVVMDLPFLHTRSLCSLSTVLPTDSEVSPPWNLNAIGLIILVTKSCNFHNPYQAWISTHISASMDQGRVRFLHLSHRQGLQKCLQLIKHIRANMGIGAVYTIVLQHYQVLLGLTTSVLEDTHMLPWSKAIWIDTSHCFLHSIQGQIILPWSWLPTVQCNTQSLPYGIMEDVLALNLPPNHAIPFSSIWLYWWVTTLSKITLCIAWIPLSPTTNWFLQILQSCFNGQPSPFQV